MSQEPQPPLAPAHDLAAVRAPWDRLQRHCRLAAGAEGAARRLLLGMGLPRAATACSAAAAAMHWVTAALTGTAMGHRRMPQRVAAARRIGQGEGASRRRLAAEAVKQGAQQAALHSRSATAVTTGRERRQEMPASVVDHRGTQVPTEAVAVHRLRETEARVHPYVVASAWRQGVLAAHLAALVVGLQPREPPARVTVAERVRRQ